MHTAVILEKVSPSVERRVIVKRDGRTVGWDPERIVRAISLAFYAVRHNNAPNPFSNDREARYGLSEEDHAEVLRITNMVINNVDLRFHRGENPTVEQVQDIVEMMIAGAGHFDVAKSYVLYRAKKAEARIHKHVENGLADYIAVSRYTRYREDLGRRELWPEAVARVFEMHRAHFRAVLDRSVPELGLTVGELIDQAERDVRDRRALPSMRSLQFGGKAIEVNHARMYNCCFGHIDHPRKFAEATWLLLSGTGVGFSVQKHHVAKLPPLPLRKSIDELPVVHFTIPDSIEGWADAVDQLIHSYYAGVYVEFNYSQIRPKGSLLRTSGGRAPGHLPLKRALEAMRGVLDRAVGRKLKPIEAYDILMYAASAVISGGVRRSATIALFSADDEEMTNAKTGDWFVAHPQRQFSNNSAVLVRREASREQFQALFNAVKQFGEPGFYFTENTEYGANPCVEIGLMPVMTVDEPTLAKLRALGYDQPLKVGDTVSGWQHCNLSTINGRACRTPEDFYALCRTAAVIGTLQAAYTDMPYLGPVTRVINEREALLGVSICGVMDNPTVLLDPAVLRRGADIAKATNAALAKVIGINRAARVTCVKPEGTASLLLGTASGIHPHHAKRYFRRVQAARTEVVYQFFRRYNPHMTEVYGMKADTTDVITFPVEAPEGAITKKDLSATKFLEIVKLVQENWVKPGTAHEDYNPGLYHNVSNTVVVRPHEWDAVADYIWENRDYFTGISILPASGDKDYPQAPLEEVTTPQDIARWNALKYNPVDYAALNEAADYTSFRDVVACAGGRCDI
ncbi:MAG: ATP cone domain-containing protein [Chloracidobacterium sp.]|nr:ATP cone domain-containing protein [Chloracidobacterium sp.]MDW8217026.1 ATP cone domain-containing protein [Acidobacteriota bacterium]